MPIRIKQGRGKVQHLLNAWRVRSGVCMKLSVLTQLTSALRIRNQLGSNSLRAGP
jgi:hypothetical protein